MSKHVPRIFCTDPLTTGGRQRLSGDIAHHLLHVLRLKPGAALRLFDGSGGEYTAELVAAHKDHAEAAIGAHQILQRESPLRLTLGQAISRGERMDYTIQKAVELGVSVIQPLQTERSLAGLESQRRQKKLHHWQEIARGAAEQSGRDRVPPVAVPVPLERWLDSLAFRRGTVADATVFPREARINLLLDPQANRGLRDLDRSADLCLLSGPEGGLSTAELERAKQAGFVGIRLGPRVLRTETAAIACLAALQTLWGDLG